MLINDLTLLLNLFGISEGTKLLIWTVIYCLAFTAPEKWMVELRQKPATIVTDASSEVEVNINGIPTLALLDTGSTVSTISYTFYKTHLSNHHIHSIDNMFSLRCANGSELPYSGYIEAEVDSPGLPASQSQLEIMVCLWGIMTRVTWNSMCVFLSCCSTKLIMFYYTIIRNTEQLLHILYM